MRDIAIVATRRRLHDDDDTVAYWLNVPAGERLAQLQRLRVEFYGWDDEAGPRLQRVHRVLHRA